MMLSGVRLAACMHVATTCSQDGQRPAASRYSISFTQHGTCSQGMSSQSAVQFGPVDDAVVMLDHENRRPRGFGFVTFANEDTVDDVLNAGPLQVGQLSARCLCHHAAGAHTSAHLASRDKQH